MCKASVYEARNNFSTLVKTAGSGEPVELNRHDKTVAIIISYEEYEKAHQKQNLMEKLIMKPVYLLDTNVISNLSKTKPNQNIVHEYLNKTDLCANSTCNLL